MWEANLDYINQHNEEFSRGEHSYNLGLNEFADLVKIFFSRINTFCNLNIFGSVKKLKDFNYLKKIYC